MPINPFFEDAIDTDIEKDMEEQKEAEMSSQYEKSIRFINNKLDLDFATLDCAAYCNHHGVTSLERTAQAILGYESLAYGVEGIGDVFQSIWSGICTLVRKVCEFFVWIWELIVKAFRKLTGKADENKQAELINEEVQKEAEKVTEELKKAQITEPMPVLTDENNPGIPKSEEKAEAPIEESPKPEEHVAPISEEELNDAAEKLYERLAKNPKLKVLLDAEIDTPKSDSSSDEQKEEKKEEQNEDAPKKEVKIDKEGFCASIVNEIKVAWKAGAFGLRKGDKTGYPKHKVHALAKAAIRSQRTKLLKSIKPTTAGLGFVMHDALKDNVFLRDGIRLATNTARQVLSSIEQALKGTLSEETPLEVEKLKFNGKEVEVFVPKGSSLAYSHTNSLDTLSEMLKPKKAIHMPGKKFVISTESLYDCGYTDVTDDGYNKVFAIIQSLMYNSETAALSKSAEALNKQLKIIESNLNAKDTDSKQKVKQDVAKKQMQHLQGEYFGDDPKDLKHENENKKKARLKILRSTVSFIAELAKLLKQLNSCLLSTSTALNKVFAIHSKYTID